MSAFEELLSSIEIQAQNRIRYEEGDFYNDSGLLICGKCRTPKQTVIDINGMTKTVMCLCKCGADRRDKEEAERKKQERLSILEEHRKVWLSDPKMRNWTFENDDGKDERLSTLAKNYVKKFPELYERGRGLILFGGVGSGKTFIAACIANALIDKGYPCMVTNFARLANTLNGRFNDRQEYLDSLNKFSLLVIDDLAAERSTEYMDEIVHTVIDGRYLAKKPLIVTTNLTIDDFSNISDVRKKRIYSRLFEMCYPYHVQGVDRRKEKLSKDYSNMEQLLGITDDVFFDQNDQKKKQQSVYSSDASYDLEAYRKSAIGLREAK